MQQFPGSIELVGVHPPRFLCVSSSKPVGGVASACRLSVEKVSRGYYPLSLLFIQIVQAVPRGPRHVRTVHAGGRKEKRRKRRKRGERNWKAGRFVLLVEM